MPVKELIVATYIQFFWIALFASIIAAILVATIDQAKAEARRPAAQH